MKLTLVGELDRRLWCRERSQVLEEIKKYTVF